MKMKDVMKLEFPAQSEYESFARVAVAAFTARLDPTIVEINEIKTAISECVTNSIIHGYKEKGGTVYIECEISDANLKITVSDSGCGIEDVKQARTPMFTTNPDGERSGMGFTVMETFMDKVDVMSECGKGTTVILYKSLAAGEEGAKCG